MRKIFIGGCDRSGTTFLASLLGSAKGSVVTPESLFKDTSLKLEDEFKSICDDWRFKTWEISPPTDYRSIETFMESCVMKYAKSKNIETPTVWIDHSPNNLENYSNLTHAFENTTFIHIIRNPYDVINSIVPLEWGPNTSFFATIFWLKKVASGLAVSEKDNVITVKYESLLKDDRITVLDGLMKSLYLTSNCDSNESVNYFLPDFTKEQHQYIGKSKPKEVKRNNLNKYDYYIINKLVGKVIKNLGYKVKEHDVSIILLVLFIIYSFFKEVLFRFFINPKKYKKKRENLYESKG